MDKFNINIHGAEYVVSESAMDWIFSLNNGKFKAELKFAKESYPTVDDAIFELKCMEEG